MGLADEADRKRTAEQAHSAARDEQVRSQLVSWIDELASEFAQAAPTRIGDGPWFVGVKWFAEGYKCWKNRGGVQVFPDGSWGFARSRADDYYDTQVFHESYSVLTKAKCRQEFVHALAAGPLRPPPGTSDIEEPRREPLPELRRGFFRRLLGD